jgi:hypothetical protein
MFKLDLFRRVTGLLALAIAVTLCAGSGSAALADVKKGGTIKKVHRHPVHGPGSSHNPIVRHPPLHGAGTSHNPIVVPKDCNDPNTVCRRP